MTRDAGPALDAEIATRVFGYPPRVKTPWGYWDPALGFVGGVLPPLPEYSTDLTAAWAIVEHLRREWEQVEITVERGDAAEPWQCALWNCEGLPEITARATTAPLAICRAALCDVALQPPPLGGPDAAD